MIEYNQEAFIDNYPTYVSMEDTENKILFQMKNCICKILKTNGKKGTGFFIKINYNNELLHLLVTNNHVLNEDDIDKDKIIEITLNDDKIFKKLVIGQRIKYTDIGFDITFIEIYPEKDKINNFLEVDDDIDKDEDLLKSLYINKSLYMLHHPKAEKINVSYGVSKGIYGDYIGYYLNTDPGSSGAPVLSLQKFKIIGIHLGSPKEIKDGEPKFNIGILLKYAIESFKKNINSKNCFNCFISNMYKSINENSIDNLVKSYKLIDVTEDGEIKKYIIKEGKGIKPNKGDEVTYYLFGNKFINETLKLNSNNPNHQELALQSMKVGEKAKFFVGIKYLKDNQNKPITYELELFSGENQEKENLEKFLRLKKLKEEGVRLFKKGDIENACKFFEEAYYLYIFNNIKYDDENKDEYINLFISTLSNLCNCYNIQNKYSEVIRVANRGLKIKEYSKFYYFRAIAYTKKDELENAKKDLLSLKKLLGEKSTDIGVKNLEEIIAKKEK